MRAISWEILCLNSGGRNDLRPLDNRLKDSFDVSTLVTPRSGPQEQSLKGFLRRLNFGNRHDPRPLEQPLKEFFVVSTLVTTICAPWNNLLKDSLDVSTLVTATICAPWNIRLKDSFVVSTLTTATIHAFWNNRLKNSSLSQLSSPPRCTLLERPLGGFLRCLNSSNSHYIRFPGNPLIKDSFAVSTLVTATIYRSPEPTSERCGLDRRIMSLPLRYNVCDRNARPNSPGSANVRSSGLPMPKDPSLHLRVQFRVRRIWPAAPNPGKCNANTNNAVYPITRRFPQNSICVRSRQTAAIILVKASPCFSETQADLLSNFQISTLRRPKDLRPKVSLRVRNRK